MSRRTYDTDEITLRKVFAISTNNQFIPAMNVLTADGAGGTYWAIPSSLGYNPSFNQIATDAGTFTATSPYNTFTLSQGGGIGFVQGAGTNQMYIYSKGFGQINTVGGNTLYGFSNNVTTPVLNFAAAGGISLQANPATNTLTFTANGQPISTTLNSFQSLKVFPNLSTPTGKISSLSGYTVLSANNYSSILTLVGTGQISLTSDYNANAVFIGLNASTLVTSNLTSQIVSTTNVTTSSFTFIDTYSKVQKNLYSYNGNLYLNGIAISGAAASLVTSVNAGSNIIMGPSGSQNGTQGDVTINVDTGFLISTVTDGYVSTATLLSTSAGLSYQIENGFFFTNLVSTANLADLVSTANFANLISTANLANLISTANLADLISTANLADLVSTANLADLVSTANLSDLISSANLIDLVSTANLADLVSTANLANLISSANLVDLVSTANLADLISSANLVDLVSTANLADLISTANLADLVSTANLADLISTANLADLISSANLSGLVSTTFIDTYIGSTVIGLGSAGYVSTLSNWANFSAVKTIDMCNHSISNVSTIYGPAGASIAMGDDSFILTSPNAIMDFVTGFNGAQFWSDTVGGTFGTVRASNFYMNAANDNGIPYFIQDGYTNLASSIQAAVIANYPDGQAGSLFISSLYLGYGNAHPSGQLTTDSTASNLYWNTKELANTDTLAQIAVTNRANWVAVGSNTGATTSIQFSYDGQTWKEVTTGGFANGGNGIAWNGSYWVAVGSAGAALQTIQYSYDGKNWSAITSGGFTSAYGIAWNGSYWVAVGAEASTIQYSYDGRIWTEITSGGFGANGVGVAWNGSYWVAVGSGGTAIQTIKYSYDGMNWMDSISGGFSDTGAGIAWSGSYWVAVGSDDSAVNSIQYSYDGINWTSSASGGFNSGGRGVGWNGSYWVAVGEDTSLLTSIKYSYDGMNWMAITSGGFSAHGSSVAWNGSYWIATGQDATHSIQYSYDGKVWMGVTAGGFSVYGSGIAWSSPLFNPTLWSTSSYTYVINGNLTVTSTINAQTGYFLNGSVFTSDRRIKTDITYANLELCYSTVRELPLHHFGFVSSFHELKRDKHQLGFIADELSTVFPKSVFLDKTSINAFSTIYFVNYEQIQMAHFGATQYMASLLDSQSSTIHGQNIFIEQQISTNKVQAEQFSSLTSHMNTFSSILQTLLTR